MRALAEGGEDAKALAGGHSLIPLMKLRLAAPSLLVDLRKLPGLRGVQRENGGWRIGALTRTPRLQDKPSSGCWPSGRPDRRPAGAKPRHDRRIAGARRPGLGPAHRAAALEGTVTVSGPEGEREIAAGDLFQDYLTTSVGPARSSPRCASRPLDG